MAVAPTPGKEGRNSAITEAFTLGRPLLPYGFSYKASCARSC